MVVRIGAALVSSLVLLNFASAALPSTHPLGHSTQALTERLLDVRSKILSTQKNLIESMKDERAANERLKTLRTLLLLQKRERELSQKRLSQLESYVSELESRRASLLTRIQEEQEGIRKALVDLKRSADRDLVVGSRLSLKNEAPHRRVIARLVDLRVKEMEALKVDLQDADRLSEKIAGEKQALAYTFQDLKEQESLLEFHQNLQADLLKRKYQQRLAQLQSYQKLKGAEARMEELITQFNARQELKRAEDVQRAILHAVHEGGFAAQRGKLLFPLLGGKVVSQFGRRYDPSSNLYIFHKGIEISSDKVRPVRAVADGKVVYSGMLPGYGPVTIIDHGAHYYSLFAHLKSLKRKVGDSISAGDDLGLIGSAPGGVAEPLYFEIRARNVAVNPLQWFSN